MILLMLMFTLLTSGCASMMKSDFMQPTSSSNFRDRVYVRDGGKLFFSGERKDKSKSCFPPSDKPICTGDESKDSPYSRGKKLNIESYSITLHDLNGYLTDELREYVFLVASEVALQRGFTKLIVDSIYYVGSCASHPCTGFLAIDFLIFNDYEDIKLGLFYSFADHNSDIVHPYNNLYLTYKSFTEREEKFRNATINTPLNAWKSYLDSAQTARSLRKKLGVLPFSRYIIKPPYGSKKKLSTIESLYKTEEH